MTKYFKLGAVSFSLDGDEQYVRRFSDEFRLIGVSAEKVDDSLDCVFSFVDKLPPSLGPYVRFSRFEVGAFWADIKDFPFIYRVQKEKKKFVVTIALNKNLSLGEKIIWIPATHQLIHPSFKTKQEALVSIFIFRIWQWIVFLKLIEKGEAFIHASSVLVDEKAYVFGSWGGVGKTTILLKLTMENPNIQFLSDDMTLVDMRGNVFLNPTPLHIYPYNWKGFPALKNRVLSKRGLIDRTSWGIWSKLMGRGRICRRMYVEQLVGNKIGRRGFVHKFFFLKRSNTQNLSISSLNNKDFIAQSLSLIQLSVMNTFSEIVYPIAAAEESLLGDIFNLKKKLFVVYKNFLKNAKTFEVTIPSNVTPEELSALINDEII